MVQIIVCLVPFLRDDGTYEMGYDDGNLLAGVLDWKRKQASNCEAESELESESEPMTVSLVALGGKAAKSVVREGLALGADRALLLTSEELTLEDPWRLAQCLCLAVHRMGEFDLLCAGGESPCKEACVMAAELLGLPQVTQMVNFEVKDCVFNVKKETAAGSEWIEVAAPCFLTNAWRKEAPRPLTFLEIQEAMEKELELQCVSELYRESEKKLAILAAAPQKRQRKRQICRWGEENTATVLNEIQKKLAFVIYGA